MNPEEQEVEAAHFELWASELEPEFTVYLLESMPEPSFWVRVGDVTARLVVWSVLLAVGVAFWVTLGSVVWWLVTR